MALPESTYRVQFHAGFTFRDATAIVPYLYALGVTHLYASPYLKARPGSTHGYDVIDHCSLNPELGTQADFDVLCDALAKHGMSQILDTVPNHVGVATNDNTWWNDVLEHGPASKYAKHFDIAWRGSPRAELRDKVLLPVLGSLYGDVLDKGEVKIVEEDSKLWAKYFERRFPLASGTAAKPFRNEDPAWLDEVLSKQHYRLAYWRTAPDEINYRRFFDINDLAALAQEHQAVFDETHALTFKLVEQGRVAGLRIDHPDGLYDPEQYFERLRQAQPGLYVLIEKILAPDEPLPTAWPVNGTSGYDFLIKTNGLFIDPAAAGAFTQTYQQWTGDETSFEDLVYAKKKLILETSLASELQMLAHRLDRIAQQDRHTRDFTLGGLRNALREVIARFPVYRSYVTARGVSATDVERVNHAVEQAKVRNPRAEPAVYDFIGRTVLQAAPALSLRERAGVRARGASSGAAVAGASAASAANDAVSTATRPHPDSLPEGEGGGGGGGGGGDAERLAFAGKFQQLTAPTTAKGIEDTAFYIYNRFVSLNEVGGEPGHFGTPADALHVYLADRQANWPYAMSALSTHDTKRSEDVRARLNVLSEMPDEWATRVKRWGELNARHRTGSSPDRNEEYLIYQTLVGAWPLEPWAAEEYDAFVKRVQAYLVKAMREAKLNTSWTDPNEAHETAVQDFVAKVLSETHGGEFLADLRPFRQRVSRLGLLNSLAQTVLRLTAPGVPDTYQGTELWDFSLVDPDNRRPVDYAKRRQALEALEKSPPSPAELMASPEDGRVKLLVTSRLLKLRREHPGLFSAGDYVPLRAEAHADRVFAFARRHDGRTAVVVIPRLASKLDTPEAWGDTRVQLPTGAGALRNVLTGAKIDGVGGVRLTDLFRDLPVAVLA